MLKVLKVIGGMIFINFIILLSWSISFTLVSYVKEKRDDSSVTASMIQDGELIGDMLAFQHSSWSEGLEHIAQQKEYSILVRDNEGIEQQFGRSSDQYPQLRSNSMQSVISGNIIHEAKRSNAFKKGTAAVGVPIQIDGKSAALIIQSETPSLYAHYGTQLGTVFLGFCIMFLGMLAFRPWRREASALYIMIEALRRMSKGDFKVNIDKNKRLDGPYGKLVESINDMANELNQMEQMRQTFISNVSHEIQSPLTSIRGFARALQQEGLDLEQRHHYYSIIETESLRLSKLSDNLLKLTSLESDQHPFEPKPYRLDKQIRRVILACEPQWLDKDIQMDVDLNEVTVIADEDLLSQVWTNLISNSIKFTPEGGTISVEIIPLPDGKGAQVFVSDNGSGISEADLPHVFERFFIADKSRNRTVGGSGLGLSIVKRIIDMHQSDIQVKSKLDAGTTFTIKISNVNAN